jgi:hypothetical protein
MPERRPADPSLFPENALSLWEREGVRDIFMLSMVPPQTARLS